MKIVTINNKTLYLTFHESSEQKQTSLLTQLTLLMQSNRTWAIRLGKLEVLETSMHLIGQRLDEHSAHWLT